MKRHAAAERREPVEWVEEAGRAATLLHPLRLRIVRLAGQAMSASEIADRLGMGRQRVNYHVRELARAGFLKRAGTRRKRNLIEQLYVASARGYLLGAGVLGPAAPDASVLEDAPAVSHLLALAARTQAEVAAASRTARKQGVTLPALSLASEVRFGSARQRAAFVEALTAAVTQVVREHTNPAHASDGGPGTGRPHRLVVFCHPVEDSGETSARSVRPEGEAREETNE
jgi:DNA-binding transcriptional ArsR family regulator